MSEADIDQLYGFQLSELVLMDCPCCHSTLADHSLTEAMRCGQSAMFKDGRDTADREGG
ncbi:MAG TPA: hypothetical protein VHT75_04215 [Acidimicrobiales bacterium]|jgi:hypothetical protein|nr:hypothetical protein [Acidimicrobiales bacterium]